MAELVASWSEDEFRKVGAVIVGSGNETIGIGYNGLPRGVNSRPKERHKKENNEKYLWYEHAERNALYNTIRAGGRVLGAKMYSSSFPCADCARAMIQSGISALHTFPYDTTDSFFSRHFLVAEEMFLEAGVDVFLFQRDDPILESGRDGFLNIQDPKNGWLR